MFCSVCPSVRVARRFLVSGRVQGVGFRWFVQDAAIREGLTGWVRNLADGRVEALVEGPSEAVGRLEAVVREGPRLARVDRLVVGVEDATGTFTTFSIA